MPFVLKVPENAPASFEISPVDKSFLDVSYFFDVELIQKNDIISMKKKGKKEKKNTV